METDIFTGLSHLMQNFADAYIQVGDDGDWFQMDTSKTSGTMRHFYTEPYYTEDELADMNVTMEYYGTASDKTKNNTFTLLPRR